VSEEPFTICEGYRREIDPEAPDTVKAVQLVPAPTFGKPNDVLEGLRVLFYEGCFVGPPLYKRA
jgi:hypothetical protein